LYLTIPMTTKSVNHEEHY